MPCRRLIAADAIFVVESTTGAEVEPLPVDSLEELEASALRLVADRFGGSA